MEEKKDVIVESGANDDKDLVSSDESLLSSEDVKEIVDGAIDDSGISDQVNDLSDDVADMGADVSDVQTQVTQIEKDVAKMSKAVNSLSSASESSVVIPEDYYQVQSQLATFNSFSLALIVGLILFIIFSKKF